MKSNVHAHTPKGKGKIPPPRPRKPEEREILSVDDDDADSGGPRKKAQVATSGVESDSGHKQPKLDLGVDGNKQSIPVAKLLDSEFAEQLKADCEQAQEPVVCRLHGLLTMTDDDRFAVLDFLATIKRYEVIVGKKSYGDLLDAVLAIPVDAAKTAQLKNLKMAALETAALIHPEALDVVCKPILDRLRALKIPGLRISEFIKVAEKIVANLRKGAMTTETAHPVKIVDAISDAPVTSDIVVPAGWSLSQQGIRSLDSESPEFTAPVIIVERGRDARRGTESVTITWSRDNLWHTRVVDRQQIADVRGIVALASLGIPVTSLNARTLVKFLHDYEAANLANLPSVSISQKMGWQGEEGQDGFLWGRQLITADTVFDDGAPSSQSGQAVRFRGADTGDDQLADGFRPSGTYEDWIKAVRCIRHRRRARLGFYAAFVPPMLQILKSNNFVMDFAGETTSGKTTELRLIASIWGNPDERNGGAVLSTWNSTATWRERAPAVCSDLPLILDDTKNVRFPDEVANTIYGIVQGHGRGRGTVQGIAHQDSCVSVLFSSGEQSATSFTKDGGTRPRVLPIWGSPFGEKNPNSAEYVRSINDGVRDHYGHAGPRFVQHILKKRDKWEAWRANYKKWVDFYEDRAGANTIAARMAAHFAAIIVTSYHVHRALELPWKWTNPIESVWDELVKDSGEADIAANALRLVIDWAAARRGNFWHKNKSDKDQPHEGWDGRWETDRTGAPDSKIQWPWIGVLPQVLDKLLSENGFDFSSTTRTWKERGWLETDADDRNTKRVQLGKALAHVVAIKRDTIEALDGVEVEGEGGGEQVE